MGDDKFVKSWMQHRIVDANKTKNSKYYKDLVKKFNKVGQSMHNIPPIFETTFEEGTRVLKDTDNLADFFMMNSFEVGDKFVYVAENAFTEGSVGPIPEKIIDCIFVKAASHGLVIRDDHWKNQSEFEIHFKVIHILK